MNWNPILFHDLSNPPGSYRINRAHNVAGNAVKNFFVLKKIHDTVVAKKAVAKFKHGQIGVVL